MWLGIDVGGTFTDAVVVAAGAVVAKAKTPSTHGNLLAGILQVLECVLEGLDAAKLERIVLSTTVVTNAVVENRLDNVALLVMPGPGMDIRSMLPVTPVVLSGYTDHRGRITAAACEDEIKDCCRQFGAAECFAVSGKFSVRNPEHELQVAEWIGRYARPQHISLGSAVAGSLNFLRRTNSAYYNAAVWRHFGAFVAAVETALQQRRLKAPVYILKADGGTIPLAAAKHQPIEAVFTGPAASVMGIMAMHAVKVPAISFDVGGTTTDIALWNNGLPLFAGAGAKIRAYPTSVRAFWLTSVGIGGDSAVWREDGHIKVGPLRRGSAMALGGEHPTLSDAMIVAGYKQFGDYRRALQAMEQVADAGQSGREAAVTVLTAAVDMVCQAVAVMIREQAAEPVYTVEDILRGVELKPELAIGVGGAADGIVPLIAERLHIPYHISGEAMVANAIGAAVAKSTLDITLRADTAQGYYTVTELGIRKALPPGRFSLREAEALAGKYLSERAQKAGIAQAPMEMVYTEEFPMVRGFQTIGHMLSCRLQIKPDVLTHIGEAAGGEDNLG